MADLRRVERMLTSVAKYAFFKASTLFLFFNFSVFAVSFPLQYRYS